MVNHRKSKIIQHQSTNESADNNAGKARTEAANPSPDRFLADLLVRQCRTANARAAVILRKSAHAQPDVLAIHPPPGEHGSLDWIANIGKPFQLAIESGETVIQRDNHAPANTPSGDHPARNYLVLVPLKNRDTVNAVAAFRLSAKNHQQLQLGQVRLETTGLLLQRHEWQFVATEQTRRTDRLRRSLEILDSVNQPGRFLESAMAFCNELVAMLACTRVSLGILDGRDVHVRAMSNADSFSRRLQAVRAIEAAMEECLDQDLEVLYPAETAEIVTTRAAAALARRHWPSTVLSLPIRREGQVRAVVTLEGLAEPWASNREVMETLRLLTDLCSPRLLDLARQDRWVGARLAASVNRGVGKILGPEHTGVKLIGIALLLAVFLLVTVKDDYCIKTNVTLKARQRQVVVAPFDTFSKSVGVEPGDRVTGGETVLGTLETADLRLELAALMAEKLGHQKEMAAAMGEGKTANAYIADTRVRETDARIRLVQARIDQARLVAPMDGWIVSKDRTQRIGAPVKAGEILFEIAGIDSLKAELDVPEALIADVTVGQRGTLAAVGNPDEKVGFVVERITPIADVVDHANVFRVGGRIEQSSPWMRPGMQGEARIVAGKRTWLWLATHRVVDWVRMKLWV